MPRTMSTALICLLLLASFGFAQDKPTTTANPLSDYNKKAYANIKNNILRSAEKMPEESYSFKPTEAVRSYGQILGHVADAQYLFCSSVLGEKSPGPKVEKTKTSKAELTAALKDAFTYCDKAYDGLTDATAAETIKFFGSDAPKLGVLGFNNMHNMEHYGNLVTYMRMKNIVPPSSEPRPQAQKPPQSGEKK